MAMKLKCVWNVYLNKTTLDQCNEVYYVLNKTTKDYTYYVLDVRCNVDCIRLMHGFIYDMRELETKKTEFRNLTGSRTQDLLISSQALLLSEPPDSLMAEECSINLILFLIDRINGICTNANLCYTYK